ncbi:ABC transporter permease [Aeromicrobium sp.]|uniref:MlaE family ABC transporter permease n=1 Tax=Aeromicrobium sp. TaxID=1871063 RepID=UPI0030BE87EA
MSDPAAKTARPRPGAAAARRILGPDSFARSKFEEGLHTFGAMIALGIGATRFAVVDIVRGRFSWEEFFLQGWFMIRVSLLPTVLVAIPFGIIVAVQVGAVAEQIGASSFTGAVNGIGVLRQGAPLVTSLLMAGAVGSALCANLGSRTVREEIDAMAVMGLNPVQRLVAPRVVAAVAVGLMLNVVVAVTAIMTGFALNVGTGVTSSGSYLGSFTGFAQISDLWLAEGKAAIFGFVATIVACHKGLTASGGAKGVADAVNQTVVLAFIMLAVINVALTQAYVSLVPQAIA